MTTQGQLKAACLVLLKATYNHSEITLGKLRREKVNYIKGGKSHRVETVRIPQAPCPAPSTLERKPSCVLKRHRSFGGSQEVSASPEGHPPVSVSRRRGDGGGGVAGQCWWSVPQSA